MSKNPGADPKRRDGGVRDSAYEQFQTALLDGRLRPGELVSQRDLIDMMDLSLGALREVLPRLQAEGLINVFPQRGIQIPAIDLPMIREAFQMRAALEREAIVHAVRSIPMQVLQDQKDLHEKIVKELSVAPTEDVLGRGQEIDDGFHRLLIEATENGLIQNAYNINAIRMRLIKLDRIRLSETTLPAAFADHLAIIEALLARDKHGAMDAMDAHITNARNRAMEF